MKYDKNVIDILRMYGESKGLTVDIRDTYHPTWNGYRKETMFIFRRRDGFEHRALLTWPEELDAVDVIKGVMTCIDDDLHRYETIDRYDIPSLYPKTMLNSFYGSKEWNRYRNLNVTLSELTYRYFNSSKPLPSIEKVIFNDPATIIFWEDGTKTIVKAQDGDVFDEEKGLAMAMVKKALGNKGNYCNELKKWLTDEGDKGNFAPHEQGEFDQKLKELEAELENLRPKKEEKK